VDNDLANELLLTLRGLAAEHRMLFWIVHHSDKQKTNYRGPTDWWASVDVMFGLLSKDGRVEVKPQKVRGGKVPDPFLIEPEWDGDRLTFRYAGEPEAENLTPADEKVRAFLLGRGECEQAIIPDQTGLTRPTVSRSLRHLESFGLVEQTRAGKGRQSATWICVVPAEGNTTAAGV
jgi:hypothetical protein